MSTLMRQLSLLASMAMAALVAVIAMNWLPAPALAGGGVGIQRTELANGRMTVTGVARSPAARPTVFGVISRFALKAKGAVLGTESDLKET